MAIEATAYRTRRTRNRANRVQRARSQQQAQVASEAGRGVWQHAVDVKGNAKSCCSDFYCNSRNCYFTLTSSNRSGLPPSLCHSLSRSLPLSVQVNLRNVMGPISNVSPLHGKCRLFEVWRKLASLNAGGLGKRMRIWIRLRRQLSYE